MKFLVLMGLLAASSIVQASQNVSCTNPGFKDAYFSATFEIGGGSNGKSNSVILAVPVGETKIKNYSTTCAVNKNSRPGYRQFLRCVVKTPGGGYRVDLYKSNTGALTSNVHILSDMMDRPLSNFHELPKCENI